MAVTVEQVVARISAWQGKQIEIQPLSGGLTNTNYRVTVDGIPHFVRIPGAKTELLAIDRRNEYHNSKAAAETGVGPKVLYHIPEYDAMVLEFIDGQTMSNQRLQAPGMPTRIAQSIKLLHGGPRFLTDFNMFRLTEYYLKVCDEHEVTVPDRYPVRMPAIQQIEQALAVCPLPARPCNNDLLAENYIDDGHLLRLIDYEYSGNNDPCFELGNTCQELGYDEERIRELCACLLRRGFSRHAGAHEAEHDHVGCRVGRFGQPSRLRSPPSNMIFGVGLPTAGDVPKPSWTLPNSQAG